MITRVIKSYRDIVTICDSNLLGKRFEEGDFQIDVKESFFKGEETSPEKTFEILKNMSKEDSTFNIVGEESIKIALKAEVISKRGIKKIQGIPFALVLI